MFKTYLVIPLLVAMIRTGAISFSNILFRKEKHSMSNICTSSINRTPETRKGRLINLGMSLRNGMKNSSET